MFKFYERTNSDRENDYYCLFLSGVSYSNLFESDTFLLTYSNGDFSDVITIPHSGTVLWKATGGAVDVFMHLNSKNIIIAPNMEIYIGMVSEELDYESCVHKHVYEMLPLFYKDTPNTNFIKAASFLLKCRSYLEDGILAFGSVEVKIDSIPLFVDENIEYEIIGRYNESLGTLQFKKIDYTNYTVSIKQVSEYTI